MIFHIAKSVPFKLFSQIELTNTIKVLQLFLKKCRFIRECQIIRGVDLLRNQNFLSKISKQIIYTILTTHVETQDQICCYYYMPVLKWDVRSIIIEKCYSLFYCIIMRLTYHISLVFIAVFPLLNQHLL